MKNIVYTIAVGLLLAVFSMTGLSCKKKEPAVPPPTPEQKAQIEESKKNVEAAKKVFAAQVNGVEITVLDLVREMNRIAPKYVQGNEKAAPATTVKIRKEALDNLIFNELAVQEAVRQGMTVSAEQINTVVDLMKKQMGSKEAYQGYLDSVGTTEEGLRKRIERSHLFEMVTAKEIYQKIKIDEKDIRAEYEKNKDAYKNGDKQMSYDEAAAIINKKMISERGAVKKKEWGNALRKNAKIEIEKDGGKS
jgi:hypothetical protein